MAAGFIWVTRGLLDGHALSGPSVVWSAGDELPKDRWLLGKDFDERLISEDSHPKQTLRCFECGIVLVTGIEDHSDDSRHESETEGLTTSVDEGQLGKVAFADGDEDRDDTSEPSSCLRCETVMQAGVNTCPHCGWSYLQDDGR